MANTPVYITSQDIENKTLLVRALRTMSERLASLEDKHDALKGKVATIPPQITAAQTKMALEANGSDPISLQSLHGVAGEPQLAKLPKFDIKPDGLLLQQFEDGHIFAVKNGAAFQVWMVIGGNPNTLYQLI